MQGFLGKLGLERSYVMLNAFLYSVYGQEGGERHADDDAIAGYRERWFGALLETARLEAVVAFGSLARAAVERWRTQDSRARAILFEPLIHPTFPDASSGGSGPAFGRAMREMLAQWNQALHRLDEAIGPRDVDRELALYGRALRKSDVAAIPAADLPAGTPEWMRSPAEWAVRRGRSAEEKRATVVVTVPAGARPWRE